jgi:L-cysteine desulfidase
MDPYTYDYYVTQLKSELLPAMGCTEPIAVAFGVARAKEVLGCIPERVVIEASGNIIKNVKSVVVPNTGGMKGFEAAIAFGLMAGNASKQLEVISEVSCEQKVAAKQYLKRSVIRVVPADSDLVFDLTVHLWAGENKVDLRIINSHTNVVNIKKNEKVIFNKPFIAGCDKCQSMSVAEIFQFASTCNLQDVQTEIARQISYNSAISDEGLGNIWGASIGRTLLKCDSNDLVALKAVAAAASGADARMSGCGLPVVINAGSGNQGIALTLPIVVYGKALGVAEEKLHRALVFANLLNLHQKQGIGRLSALCGAVNAGCAAGAGIAFMQDWTLTQISRVIVNCLAINTGIICDGAKPSCAAKIASSVQASLLAYNMVKENNDFISGEGIIKEDVESTIRAIWTLGKEGMRETDKVILRTMTSN